ncbi:hypothetical protein Tco_1516646 [Tanacetum coccineum]
MDSNGYSCPLLVKIVDTFKGTMLLNVDQTAKATLTKYEFQEGWIMDSFWVESRFNTSEIHYPTLGNLRSPLLKNTSLKEVERRVNKRQMQTQESKIDTGKALDADLVDTESIRSESTVQADNNRSGNDTDVDDADIRPIYDKEPMAEEVNSHAKIQSYKTRNSNKPLDQKSHTQKPGRQIFIGHRFSTNKTSAVYEKTSPRSDLRWKPMGRIFKSVGLRWIPTGKLFDSYTSKVDSERSHGLNVDIPNIHECKQTLDFKPRTTMSIEVHQAAETVTTSNELELLFGTFFDEYFKGENQVVSKSSAVTTTDESNKRQQQPDSTSSTSTLATTVSANGNFDF